MATIRKILLELRKELLKVVQDEKRVTIVAQRPPNHTPTLSAGRDILIRPRGFVVDQNTVAAAGRAYTPIRRQIELILRSTRSTDTVNADRKFLTEEGIGQVEFEDQVFDVIQMWQGNVESVVDGDPLLLVGEGEPVRVVSGGDAARDFVSPDGKWGASTIVIEVMYRQELDQTRQ